MKLVEFFLILVLVLLCSVTYHYYKKHEKMMNHRKKRAPKYEIVELSDEAKKYDEYYEPKIIEIVSSDEYL